MEIGELVGGPSGAAGAATQKTQGKRLTLSCTKCRARKVKCDRVKPCGSCSIRGEAKECRFPTDNQADFQAVNQAYEIRRLRKEVDHWRTKFELLQREASLQDQQSLPGISEGFPVLGDLSSRSPSRTLSASTGAESSRRGSERELMAINIKSHLHFGAPALSTVINEFTNMHVKGPVAQTYHGPKAIDVMSARHPRAFPFPTLWNAVDGIAAVWGCLPPVDEILAHVQAFRVRAQCAYPYIYTELQDDTVIRDFVEGGIENGERQPSLLALILISIALGMQCSVYYKKGNEWVKGAMEEERRTSEVYFAASFQALRIMGFTSRPDAVTLMTLLMMLPYLTNSGRCSDAWVVHGMGIRVAQSMGYHRDPALLRPPPTPGDAHVRRILWWWVLYQDVHLSMIFGRPLGVSGIGDVLPPELVTPMPATFQEFVLPYTVLMRQLLSGDELTEHAIDKITGEALGLLQTLPKRIQFDPATWISDDFQGPPWPLNMLAVLHVSKVHNMVILLNRRRKDMEQPGRKGSMGVGLQRILRSSRLILKCQEFMHKHARQGLLCWFSNQCWFNASMILGLNILTHGNYPEAESDTEALRQSYLRFKDEADLGIHELAEIAVEHLGRMFQEVGIHMEGVEYHHPVGRGDGRGGSSSGGSLHVDMNGSLPAGMSFEADPGGIPQSFGWGLKIPDVLFKNGEVCSNAWHYL
ncbi:hypothetical protein DRE_07771 [Drechslerella stenobrocha 248]|uniref:Zn(2)-C6 fungal-type domain-containing protein n=1 Tax=Drechslerella stenobrocha 248 TaxID=1043628 RepID=W7I899_9PEZI|nr:hypothetical protein DRE_07771 [Drechslerella stenobrocha 248]